MNYNLHCESCNVVLVGLPDVDEFISETSGMLQTHRRHVSTIETYLYVSILWYISWTAGPICM